jgi:hypothetical protein
MRKVGSSFATYSPSRFAPDKETPARTADAGV